MTLRSVTLLCVAVALFLAVLYVFARLASTPSPPPAPPIVAAPHGGCVLDERLGPDTRVCRDGTVWHHRVDGPEYEGNLNTTHGPTLLVPAPQK